jgi:hypothetical protein
VLDQGFQLINPTYPELVATGVMKDFDLRRFTSAVRFSEDNRPTDSAIRERTPRLVASLRHPDLSFTNALKIGFMLAALRFSSATKIV